MAKRSKSHKGHFKGKLWSGSRFKDCERKVHGKNKGAICAKIGMKAHGKKNFERHAHIGERRANTARGVHRRPGM